MEKIKDVMPLVESWLKEPYREEFRNELKVLIENKNYDELYDRFYKSLEFGTGGMRGIMGAGTNRMNIYTVAAATKGLSDYLKKMKKNRVVVSYDTRNNSQVFSEIVVKVLSNLGIKTFYFSKPYPTPFLSFMTRKLNAIGVMITASHNPPEYNGYKVFWDNGVQVLPPHDINIVNTIKKVKIYDVVSLIDSPIDYKYAEDITEKFDDEYINTIMSFIDISKIDKDTKVLYTPLYGTGRDLMKKLMSRLSINLDLVEEEAVFDGNFPGINVPNPEEPKVFKLALKKASEYSNKYDIIIGTDPDADRLGVWVKHNNDYIFLNGNQIGTIMLYYLLSNRNYKKNSYCITTIVSSDIIEPIAKEFNVKFYKTLTGFKYIGDLIMKKKSGFIFGYEESFGYLIGDYIGDKDGISAAGLLSEIVSYIKSKKMSLYEYLESIYSKYGYYYESLRSFNLPFDKQKKIMNILRGSKDNLAGYKIKKKIDLNKKGFKALFSKDIYSSLPKSDVLMFYLEPSFKVAVRPSGTEPKIKFYFAINHVKDKNIYDLRKCIEEFENIVLNYVKEVVS
ncbi:MAG TPA: phospho-sugar mutase [Spirochaetota bacterium]|nr:phospho-sugar mutase [Spirochaetota bacterium]HPQ49086.1 phospho-sugar mutase [Spirochaetota bacterium]